MSTADKSGVSPPTKKPKLLSEFVVGSNGVVGVSASTPTSESQNLAGSNSNSMEMEVNGSNHTDGQNGSGEIDDSLYSRQRYAIGDEAMKKMAKTRILISGLGGIGVEIAKNVILGGVKSVTLHDTNVVSWADLSSQFYVKESDIGMNRAEVSQSQLGELNQYVPVTISKEPLTLEFMEEFQVVVFADRCGNLSTSGLLELAQHCHEKNIPVILAETRGVFSRLFCDFGKKFRVSDVNGAQPITALIANITQEETGVVTCLDETRHGLEDGDYVTFVEVEGMEELNAAEPTKIKVTGPYTFTIGDTSNFGLHTRGGKVVQVKMPVELDFKPLPDALDEPDFLISDYGKMEHPQQLHLGFRALDSFFDKHGRLPRPWNATDAEELLERAKEINEKAKHSPLEKLDDRLLRLFSFTSSGNLSPLNAFLGGVAAQEVMKACSGKFHPVKQWLYYDCVECLPQFDSDVSLDQINEADFAPSNCRYDGNIAVFGKDFQVRLGNLKYFVVGAGAIGCELLKNFAMMGVGTEPEGKVFVTDMDRIERSNLNRQFLFRNRDVGNPKSTTAAKAARVMNPDMNVEAHENFVGPKTEDFYTDKFFEALDGVANALDNIEARTYVDRRCVYYCKPLLESGTLGTLGNTQVVLPYVTESYSTTQDPPEKSIPICTLKNFPNAIEHTLQWARELFEAVFTDAARYAADYLNDPKFIENTQRKPGSQPVQDLEAVRKCLVDERPKNMEDCVKWARLFWEENFNNQIQQLLYNFPPDQETTGGQPFWSPPKRCPEPLTFTPDTDDSPSLAIDFVYAAANLRAELYGIPQVRDRTQIANMALAVEVPHFAPRKGVQIAANDSEMASMEATTDQNRLRELIESIPKKQDLPADLKITPLQFEKDVDTNFHIDFITAASNSRAANYRIPPVDRLQTKLIAGRIIPAIATTTSAVAGLVGLELYKVVLFHLGRSKEDCVKYVERFKNSFINLALPFFGTANPVMAEKKKYYDVEWTLWDRFDVRGEMTLKEFMDYFDNNHGLKITMLSQGVCMLFSFFMDKNKKEERLVLPLCEVVRRVSKARQAPHVRHLVLELCCNDREGDDVEVPYVRYEIPESQRTGSSPH